jgi:import inner membrane translocase subunit TIM17
MDEYTREPCPYRILDDIGGAFAMGTIGGGVFHGVSGFRNAPKGLPKRLYGSVTNIGLKSPITGGQFAAWGGMFSLIDCGLVHLRKKEDPWNGIISGAATGGLLMIRSGPAAIATSAIIGGVLLALIEGIGIGMNRMMAWQFDPTQEVPEAPSDPGVLGSKPSPSPQSQQDSSFGTPFSFSSGLPSTQSMSS